MTRGRFANEVTKRLGAKVTLHTRRAWQAQMQAEGGDAKHNPFNTTLRMPGSTDYNKLPNGVAVQNYTSAEQGIEATVKTLKENGHGYEEIRKMLRANATAVQIVTAIGRSAWGTDATLALQVLDEIKRGIQKLETLERKLVAS